MRILLLTPVPPDPAGAGAIPALLHAQVVGLIEHHDVTLVTGAGPDEAELEAAQRVAGSGIETHVVRRVLTTGREGLGRRSRMARAWLAGRWPWRTVWYWNPEIQHVVDRLLRAEGYDVVAVEDNALGVCNLPDDVARTLTEYEVQPVSRSGRPPRSARDWPTWALRQAERNRWHRYQRDVWTRFDAIQVFSERDAAAAAGIAPELAQRVRVAPFGIDFGAPATDPREVKAGSIIFVGNYSHPPNVDSAVWLAREILPRVQIDCVGAELWLVGSQAPAAVRRLQQPGVRVFGYVPDVDRLLSEAAVVAAPVRSGGGMRMKILHSMALGKAVVTTRLGTEGLTTGGRQPPLVVAEDTDAIARSVVRLLNAPAERAALGARARAFAFEHHSPSAYAARLETVYADAIERANVRRRYDADG